MNHAIHILKTEQKILKKCLSEWDLKNYPEARKLREKKLKQITEVLNKLNNYEN